MVKLEPCRTAKSYFEDLSNTIADAISDAPSPDVACILAKAVFDVAKNLID